MGIIQHERVYLGRNSHPLHKLTYSTAKLGILSDTNYRDL